MKGAAALGGLLFAPALVLASAFALRNVSVSDGAASGLAFGLGSLAAMGALALAAKAALGPRASIGLALAALLVGTLAALSPDGIARVAAVDTALVAFAHAAGSAIGRRVAHPGHLLPACAVAAAADVASVLSPSGPSHAIAKSETALSLLAISFPVPGVPAVAPVLGLGDLVFFALLLGASAAHAIPLVRTAVLGLVGAAFAGLAAGLLGIPVPALVPIGAVFLAGTKEARSVAPKDKTAAQLAVLLAAAVAGAVLLRAFLAR